VSVRGRSLDAVSLAEAVEALVRASVGFGDADLDRAYAWRDYGGDGLRFALLVAHQELRTCAADLAAERDHAASFTLAQRTLGQYGTARRDLTGILAGVRDDEWDRAPAEAQWPLRTVVAHVLGAERAFLAAILLALDAARAGRAPTPPTREERAARVPLEEPAGDGAAVRDALGRSHARVLHECVAIADAELPTPSFFWEAEPYPVRFRLGRFEAHLRQHAVQAEKTLAGIAHPPTEAERLARLLHGALGEAEGALVGAPPSLGAERLAACAATIGDLARQVAAAAR